MAARVKTKTDRKKLAERIAEMRRQGKKWPEIIKATKVAGPATGRRLLREFKLDDGVIKSPRKGAKPKPTTKKTPAKRGTQAS